MRYKPIASISTGFIMGRASLLWGGPTTQGNFIFAGTLYPYKRMKNAGEPNLRDHFAIMTCFIMGRPNLT